ncbi:MAG TPA: hypothetical protein VEC08_05505 [Nitrososphaerales archaeon]|nr:hypothetical protein [Nitrososphaerales archaeon]
MSRTGVATPRFSENDLYGLAEKYGTPYFLIDEQTLQKKVNEIEEAFSEFKGAFRVAYSVKANFNPSVIKTFVEEGIVFDVTAPAELRFVLKCGGSTANVIYTSITETLTEYEDVLALGVRKVVVASYNGLINLGEAAARVGVLVETMVRVNPEVHVHAELRGSMGHGKFGLEMVRDRESEDSAYSVLRRILSTPNLKFEGFHFHLGSQIEDPSCYAEAIEKLEAFILGTRKDLGHFDINTLDIGGGLPVPYGKRVPTPRDFSARIVSQLHSLGESLGRRFTLVAESGRFLTAESTILVAKVVNTKQFGDRRYVYVDAGYHILLDAALLRHEYPVEVVSNGKAPLDQQSSQHQQQHKTVLVGRLCDPLDVFPTSTRSKLAGAEPGKLVVFREVGAYSIVMNMPFHSQPKPYVLMRNRNGSYRVARRGQDAESLFMAEGGDCLQN